jgi:hypothetical protein
MELTRRTGTPVTPQPVRVVARGHEQGGGDVLDQVRGRLSTKRFSCASEGLVARGGCSPGAATQPYHLPAPHAGPPVVRYLGRPLLSLRPLAGANHAE